MQDNSDIVRQLERIAVALENHNYELNLKMDNIDNRLLKINKELSNIKQCMR